MFNIDYKYLCDIMNTIKYCWERSSPVDIPKLLEFKADDFYINNVGVSAFFVCMEVIMKNSEDYAYQFLYNSFYVLIETVKESKSINTIDINTGMIWKKYFLKNAVHCPFNLGINYKLFNEKMRF